MKYQSLNPWFFHLKGWFSFPASHYGVIRWVHSFCTVSLWWKLFHNQIDFRPWLFIFCSIVVQTFQVAGSSSTPLSNGLLMLHGTTQFGSVQLFTFPFPRSQCPQDPPPCMSSRFQHTWSRRMDQHCLHVCKWPFHLEPGHILNMQGSDARGPKYTEAARTTNDKLRIVCTFWKEQKLLLLKEICSEQRNSHCWYLCYTLEWKNAWNMVDSDFKRTF